MEDFESIWDHQYSFLDGKLAVKVHEDLDAGLGGTLFDGSIALVHYLEHLVRVEGHTSLAQNSWIELGAGCGLPGLFVGSLGAEVVLTDVGGVAVDLLEENIQLNNLTEVAQARALDWAVEQDLLAFKERKFDFILAADTIYSVEAVEPFLSVCLALSKPGTRVLFAHPKARVVSASQKFWEVVHDKFTVEKVDPSFFVQDLKEGSKQFVNPQQGVFILRPRES